MKFSARQAALAMKGELVGPDFACDGASIDSRAVRPGQLFFAIRGRRDGARFAPAALEAGAAGAVVERGAPHASKGLIRVEDTIAALAALARCLRLEQGPEVVAITGSVGKTTTREAAARAIGASRTVFSSPGNWNNHLGVPLSILAAGDQDIWVMELAMSAPGEIRDLAGIVVPDCGLITAVEPAHLEGVGGSVDGVAAAKGELFEALPPDATALIAVDEDRILAQADRFPGHRITFGFREEGADIGGRGYARTENGLRFEARAFGGDWQTVRCGLSGAHNARNVLGGLAAAVAMGVPLDRAAAGVASLAPLPGRGARVPLAGGAVAIDETYNSSPAGLRAAIADLAETPARRRILVAGAMRELGDQSADLHAECGVCAAEAGLDRVLGVGALGRRIAQAAGRAGVPAEAFETLEEVAEAVSGAIREGDLVLFKASRAVGLERALERLKADA